jgi:DNA modification methylase
MTPYYQDEAATIYRGDCREVLPSLSVDLAVTDPPYNVGFGYGESVNDARVDYEGWCREWFQLLRSSASTVAFTIGTVNIGMWYRIEEPRWMMAWHKPTGMGRAPVGWNKWEPILLYGQVKAARGIDVITANIVSERSADGHPCPKPELWAAGLIDLLSDPGETVIDPFMGSGTVLVAAKRLGRKSIGIDSEEKYCEMAAKRLAQAALPFADMYMDQPLVME